MGVVIYTLLEGRGKGGIVYFLHGVGSLVKSGDGMMKSDKPQGESPKQTPSPLSLQTR